MIEQVLNPANWRDLGAITVVTLGTVLILVILYKMLMALLAYFREGRLLEHDETTARIGAEQGQTKALNALADRLKEEQTLRDLQRNNLISLSQTVASLATVVAELKKEMGGVRTDVNEIMKPRDDKLDLMHQDIKAVPAEVWRQGDPKLVAIRDLLETYLEGMEQRIIGRIDPAAENARQAVSNELQRARCQFDEQLERLFGRLDGIAVTLTTLAGKRDETDRSQETVA